jgi:hypothetical protein
MEQIEACELPVHKFYFFVDYNASFCCASNKFLAKSAPNYKNSVLTRGLNQHLMTYFTYLLLAVTIFDGFPRQLLNFYREQNLKKNTAVIKFIQQMAQ